MLPWCRKRRQDRDSELVCELDTSASKRRAGAGAEVDEHICRDTFTSKAIVNCRGVRFQTLVSTLLRFGESYLSMQTQISTPEEIYLDFSSAAFQILLDAMTLARHDLAKALLHLAQNRCAAADLPALLHFLGIDWTLGVHLPLPPSPPDGTPRSESMFHASLGAAYHLESGVFHHLARASILNKRHLTEAVMPLPCRYDRYDLDLPLKENEMYEGPATSPKPGCIPVSVETYDFYLLNENDADDTYGEMVYAAIHMLSLEGDFRGNKLDMFAGSAVVLDLGPRRALCCDGFVLKIFRRSDGDSTSVTHDLLTVEIVSDLSREHESAKLICQHLPLVPGSSTFCRVEVPPELRRLARMFRLRLDPFQADRDESEWHEHEMVARQRLYRLDQVELFGDLLDVPSELVPEGQLIQHFSMPRAQERVLHVRLRRPRRVGERL